jgi:hypothetical protein
MCAPPDPIPGVWINTTLCRAAPVDVSWIEGPGGICPCQGFFRVHRGGVEHAGYFRSRHGVWSLDIGPESTRTPGYVCDSTALWSWSGADAYDGHMLPDVARAVVDACLAMPEWPAARR